MDSNNVQFIESALSNICCQDQEGFINADGGQSVNDDAMAGIHHYDNLNALAVGLVDHLQNGETLRLNSVSRKAQSPIYVTTSKRESKRKPVGGKCGVQPRADPREPCFRWLCRRWIALFVVFVGSLSFWTVGLLYAHGFESGSVQGSTGASTGVADSEWMKRLESNITELKQRIAPQEQQIVFLKNSTKENEKVINSLKEALELEQAKNRALNQTVKSYETRLKNEERKTSSHNQTLLQLRALHDALKNTTSSSTQSLAANIEEIDKRLQIVLSTMQGLNQTSRLDNIQSMIVEESQFRQSNDSALSQLIKENAVTRQQSIANLTADISTVQTASNQNIHNLEARLNSSINTKVAMLQTDDQTLFSQVSNVNQSILHMIRNISLTPGPQGPIGPAGPGNLTGCREESTFTQTSSTFVRVSLTYDNVNRIVVGVLCHATLPAGIELYPVSSSEKGCKCDVRSTPGATWNCWIRLWTCPKTS